MRVRNLPNTTDSKVVASLRENSYWHYTGVQSNEKEKLSLRGQEYDTYWYNIDVGDCVSGWVYGGAIEFVEEPASPNISATIFFSEGVEKLIGKDTLQEVTSIISRFDQIQTAKALLDYYDDSNEHLGGLLRSLTSSIYYGGDGISEEDMNCVLGAFEFVQLCSECGEELYAKSNVFLEKAKTTDNNLDDAIFQLMYDAVGDYNSFNVGKLSEHDCDFCWHSILGDGQILAFWKRVAKIWEVHRENTSEIRIESIMQQLAEYLLWEMESSTYMYSQEKVLTEYDEIIKVLKKIDWRMAKEVAFGDKKLRTKIEAGTDITFGCENQDCATVVMKKLFPNN